MVSSETQGEVPIEFSIPMNDGISHLQKFNINPNLA